MPDLMFTAKWASKFPSRYIAPATAWPFLEPRGLTFPKYLVTLELFRSTSKSVGELGAKLKMDTGTITPLLMRLDVSCMATRP